METVILKENGKFHEWIFGHSLSPICYDLWFILEGKGANKGSVLEAKCKCKGGQDGGCKHIAAAMYSLEDLLNSLDKDSVTSGPCLWTKRPRSNTQSRGVKELKIEKTKKPSRKKKKLKHEYSQSIDVDVRSDGDREAPDPEYLRNFTEKMCKLETVRPAIMPLFRKLFYSDESPSPADDETDESTSFKQSIGILKEKYWHCGKTSLQI
jgi:hypothetical protein